MGFDCLDLDLDLDLVVDLDLDLDLDFFLHLDEVFCDLISFSRIRDVVLVSFFCFRCVTIN